MVKKFVRFVRFDLRVSWLLFFSSIVLCELMLGKSRWGMLKYRPLWQCGGLECLAPGLFSYVQIFLEIKHGPYIYECAYISYGVSSE